jgi:hypothetical protein
MEIEGQSLRNVQMPKPDSSDEGDLIRKVMQAHLHCAQCGYDVTGAGDLCPECGQYINVNDVESVTVGPKGQDYKKIGEASTAILRWLVIGAGILLALGALAGLAALIRRTDRMFPP